MADFNRQPTIFPNGIDLKKQEAKNLVLQNINARTFDASYLYKSETIKVPGLIIFDPEDNHAKIWVNDRWKTVAYLGEGGGGGSSSLIQLDDVSIKRSELIDGDMIVWNPNAPSASGEKGAWVTINKNDIKPDPKDFLSSSVKLKTQNGIIGGGFLIDNLTIKLDPINGESFPDTTGVKITYDKFGRVVGSESKIGLDDVIDLKKKFTEYLKLDSTELQTVTGKVQFNENVSFNGSKGISVKGTTNTSNITLNDNKNELQVDSNFYSLKDISAGGIVSTGVGTGGNTSLILLDDVQIEYNDLVEGDLVIWNSTLNRWVKINKSEFHQATPKLSELPDVNINEPKKDQVLVYDDVNQEWVNKPNIGDLTLTDKPIIVKGGPVSDEWVDCYGPDPIPEKTPIKDIITKLLFKEIYPKPTYYNGGISAVYKFGIEPDLIMKINDRTISNGSLAEIGSLLITTNNSAETSCVVKDCGYTGLTYGYKNETVDSKDTFYYAVKGDFIRNGEDSYTSVADKTIVRGNNYVSSTFTSGTYTITYEDLPSAYVYSNANNIDSKHIMEAKAQHSIISSVVTKTITKNIIGVYPVYSNGKQSNIIPGDAEEPTTILTKTSNLIKPGNTFIIAFPKHYNGIGYRLKLHNSLRITKSTAWNPFTNSFSATIDPVNFKNIAIEGDYIIYEYLASEGANKAQFIINYI